MDKLLKDKIVLGSTYRGTKLASIYGKMCLEHVSLIKVILELKNYCKLNLDYETATLLETKAKDIQTKYKKEICDYKTLRLQDIKFIN